MTKEEYAQMLEAMRKRTVAEPQNAEAWRDLAQAKLMGGDQEGAENDLITSLNLDPLGGVITEFILAQAA